MHYLSSCSIVKNESKYIYDFYKIHKKLGVEFFRFYDRTTEGKPLEEIFKDHSDVEVIHFPEPNRHSTCWYEGVIHFTGKSKWVQFVDIDQVVVPMKTDDIKTMLEPYEPYAALGLNWHSFGSSGRDVEPMESTYEAYTKRAAGNTPINNHIQSIVQPDKVEKLVWRDPHHPIVKNGETQINENFKPFKGPFNMHPTQNVGFIAHYYTRSREYWAKKLAKGRADIGIQTNTLEEFDHHQTYMNEVEDITVYNIWKSIK